MPFLLHWGHTSGGPLIEKYRKDPHHFFGHAPRCSLQSAARASSRLRLQRSVNSSLHVNRGKKKKHKKERNGITCDVTYQREINAGIAQSTLFVFLFFLRGVSVGEARNASHYLCLLYYTTLASVARRCEKKPAFAEYFIHPGCPLSPSITGTAPVIICHGLSPPRVKLQKKKKKRAGRVQTCDTSLC